MALSKVNFAGRSLEVFTVVDSTGEKWHQANPFADALGYNNVNKAVRTHVSEENQKNYDCFESAHGGSTCGLTDESSVRPPSIQAKTKFINTAGVFELINASEMPAAKRFRTWENNDLLPTLCHEGEYNMAKDAPTDIAVGMNAVHAATNDGADAPWMRDLVELKASIVEKDEIIKSVTRENNELSVALRTATDKLKESNEKLVTFATALIECNKGLVEASRNAELARKETAELANRMADIAQDVIAKPSDPQLLHSLAVCAMGGDQYAFLRPQRRSLKRSLDRLSVGEKDIVFKSDYVPNSMNVLNKVKERLPKEKYKARHNRITLHDDLTKEDLLEAIESTVTSRQVAIIVNKANTTTNKNA
ncbi:40.2 kDa BRO-like protein [Spodoptera frugiperda ascovirus 1a]|uniref:40.2 kDa BRO-like protein n=1 Tax=Spodoptera frugiperda ascovirus 1a TaxID=113370 RepID=Q8JJX4_SFAVA|nr:40.2 kDa BRO-like protein [Spodoptera frugiperda ascovirus 1a]CAC84478.1 AV1-BRO-17 protein [Spodoptera frugiperda ascovirus 1a]CAL44679.1 40.2 kDa BRO-like protein [Spodoptera frugiperda ascovirus 1a]